MFLRIEVEQLRAADQEAHKTKESLSASVNRIMESRDTWQREAERLSALMAQVPPWSLLWWRCLGAFKATDRIWHCARAGTNLGSGFIREPGFRYWAHYR